MLSRNVFRIIKRKSEYTMNYPRYLPFVFFYIVILFCYTTAISEAQELYLNEILASNSSGIQDEDGDNEDWMELYYAGTEALNLHGYGLSDDYERPFRWVFPDITIQPGEFLVVWASGKDRVDPQHSLHTNFSIAAAGEEITLTAPDSTRIDELPPTALPTDVSIGRQPDGTGEWYFFTNPTPGASNTSEGYQETLSPVVFSPEGGFYTDSQFHLSLSHPDSNITIIYSIDGSEPEPENIGGQSYQYKTGYRGSGTIILRSYESKEYTGPIGISDRTDEPNVISRMHSTYDSEGTPYYYPSHSIFKGTTVRAKAVKAGAIDSPTITHTYFVSPQGRSSYSFPVVSIAIQQNHFFDYVDGIYVPGKVFDDLNPWASDGDAAANYNRRGIEWERPASIEIFEPESYTAALRQNIGIRIHGGWSRSEPMKSLRLYARNEYGDSRFFHRIFPNLHYTEYNRLLLRNSGNDWPFTMFRDAFIQKLSEHLKFDILEYRPAIVFINGEYWGIHNFRERYDRHYLSRVYGVETDKVDLLEGNAEVQEGSNQHYIETLNYINTNRLVSDEHYEYIKTRIDIENYLNYQIAQIYSGNRDWPGNNIDFWRYQTDEYNPDAPYGQDGRWRWLMYDTEFGFGLYGGSPSHNTLELATATNGPSWPNPPWSTRLFRRLLENGRFRIEFINRFADQLNSAFQPDRVLNVLDAMAQHVQPEIGEHVARWKRPGSVQSWQNEVNVMRNYAQARPGFVRNHIRSYFGIQNIVSLTIGINYPTRGRIVVNSIEISQDTPGIGPHPFPWTGTYFQGIPVTVRAKPNRGYRFSHWVGIEGEPVSTTIELPMTGTENITAVFEQSEIFPVPARLIEGNYIFNEWSADEPTGRYPENMAFVYMDDPEPGLDANVAGFTEGAYNLESRTRINGLGPGGFSFINTGNEEGNPGYPGLRLGGAIVAIDTRELDEIYVSWTGMTVLPNSRVYNIRLQYRIGDEGPFQDVPDENGDPVEYERNEEVNHRQQIGPIQLPEEVNGQEHVQLLWRYYFTGIQSDAESGQRSQMAISNITIRAGEQIVGVAGHDRMVPDRYLLHQNYPNPFNPTTQIRFELPEETHVELNVYDILGRLVDRLVNDKMDAGIYTASFDASNRAGGVYIYQLRTGTVVQNKRMVYLK
jgi:hypothetical protein